MAALWNRAGHYIFVLWFLLCSIFFLLFFLACSQPLQIGCLPYHHTWCGLSANLGYRSETCCTRLAENTGCKKSPKICHLGTIAQLCWVISSQLRHILTIGKTCQTAVSPPYVLTVWLTLPTSGWDWFVSLGHPWNFSGFCLGFITAATLLNRNWPNFARCLAVSWAGTLYIHFRGSCPVTEFCQVQNSLCIQVLRSPILAALLHGTQVVNVSQTLRRCAEGATYIRQGGHHVGHWPTF